MERFAKTERVRNIRGICIALTMMFVLVLSSLSAYAGAFELTGTYPENDYSKVEPKNVMIKLSFNDTVSSEAAEKANAKAFTFKDSEGKSVPFDVLLNSKDDHMICLVLKEDLASSTEYTLNISEDLVNDAGDTLGKKETLKFKTRNSASDGTINMLLMLVMMGVMIFFTMRDTKKSLAAQEEEQGTAVPTNPYKYAKEKGISVEQANKEIAELRAKQLSRENSPAKKKDDFASINAEYEAQKKRKAEAAKAAKEAKALAEAEKRRKTRKVKTKRRVKYDK